jgi:type IV pilus assembly protein PilV
MLVNNINYKQKGFTLIEVLIAFVILSVGLLSIVSLQAMSKIFTHQALQRTMAVSLADSIVERIRTNPGALLTYTATATVGGGTKGAEPVPNCMVNAVCSNIQLATHDLWEWEQNMDGATVTAGGANASGLITPQACLSFAPRAGMTRTGFLTVRVQWTGLNSISDAVTVSGTNCNAGIAENTDLFRRQVVVTTYVIDESEL